MTIAEVSRVYQIPVDTLRYYERIGLLPPVNRNRSGFRDYTEENRSWVQFIKCMRAAGIPVEATGIATGVISLIGLTPDIFVPPIVSRFIDHGESIGDVQVGFNMMLAWILVWALLGIVASIILKKKREKALNA